MPNIAEIMPGRKTLTDAEIIAIGTLYRQGWGQVKIAEAVGRSEWTVRNVLRGKHRRYRDLLGGRLMAGKRNKQHLAIYRGQSS